MSMSFSKFLPAAAMFACLATAAAAQEPPNEVEKSTHGAWSVRCVEETDSCVMVQAGKGERGNDVIEVRIRALKDVKAEDGTAVPAAIQVLAPLGVLLPAGLRIQVDSKQVRGAPFEVCGQAGCVVRQPVSGEFLDEMKAGNNAKVTLVAAPNNEVNVNVSLSGFTKAFGRID